MNVGDVILFRTKLTFNPLSWIAAGIRFFTKYPYNHVGVVVENWGKRFIYEMTEKGLEITDIDKRLKDQEIQILRKDRVNYREFCKKANNLPKGKKYDFVSLFLYQPIFQISGIWIGRENSKADRLMYCSELAAYLHDLKEYWLYSPDMLAKNEKFKIIN